MSEEASLRDFSEKKSESQEDRDDTQNPTILSDVPDSWEKSSLGDVAENRENSFVDGPFGGNLLSEEFHKQGFARILKLQNIRSGHFVDTNKRYITREKFQELERHAAYPHEIAIAKMAEPVARACLLPELENQYILAAADCVKLDTGDGFSNSFVMHALNSYPVWKQAFSRARGTGRKRINLNQLKEVVVPTPPLEEQRKIATVLYTVDQAIQKTEEIIGQSTRIRRGVMQDIFKFGITPNGELRQPDSESYRETNYGEIPDGWKDTTLGQLVPDDSPIVYGILKPGSHQPDGIPVVKVKDIYDGRVHQDDLLYTATEIHKDFKRAELQEGDLLFTIRGTVGRMAFVPGNLEGGNITQDTARIRVRGASPRYTRYYLETSTPNNYFERNTIGQAVQGINLGALRELPVHLPMGEEQERIVDILDAHTEQIETERKHRNQLKRLKQGLMQDLLSGAVRTDDVDIEVLDDVLAHG